MRGLILRLALTLAASSAVALGAAGGAQAVVVDMDQAGGTVSYGLALDPVDSNDLADADVSAVTSSGSCEDPSLAADFGPTLPANALCWHGGSVLHANETFALTWDAGEERSYWETTRDYVEQYLSDVAAGSGTLTSPYAVTSQYTDGSGRAANKSLYGGGCIDYGSPGGYTCKFENGNASGTGSNYPTTSSCTVAGNQFGTNQFYEEADGTYGSAPNQICLTDADIRNELAGSVSQEGIVESSGMLNRVEAGYTPVVVVLTPPGVEVCLDSSGEVCSANGDSTVKFCSYHSEVEIGGAEIPYVVQPWTASWTESLGCDDPEIPGIPFNPGQALTPTQATTFAQDVGERLVSPLSQGQIATITNPFLNGWFGLQGQEINDNGCIPETAAGADSVAVGTSSYFLQREFNNGGALESDPNAPKCAPSVELQPEFVVPGAVHSGDEVQFDGSTSISTLLVPKAGYFWWFGDGDSAYGPSVVHTYAKGGAYDVTLLVKDRGGNYAKLTQVINVIGPGGGSTSQQHSSALKAALALMPESLHSVLNSGISMHVTVNETAAGFVSISIPRSEAHRAHIAGRGSTVVIGRGTVSRLKHGTASLRLRMPRSVVAKLKHLRQVTLTVRLQLVGTAGDHVAVDVAGRY